MTDLLSSKSTENKNYSNCCCFDGLLRFFQQAKKPSTSVTQTQDESKKIIGQSSKTLQEKHHQSHAAYIAQRDGKMEKLEQKKKRLAEEKEARETEKKKNRWF